MIPSLSSAIGAAPRPWWDYKADCDVALVWGAAASIGTKLYVAGGGDDSNILIPTNRFREWTQPAGSSGVGAWASKANLPLAVMWFAAASIGTKLYISGGTDNPGFVRAELREWDQASNTWSSKANMPINLTQHGMAAIGTKLYVAGGTVTGSSPYSVALYEWDQASNTWSSKANMPGARTRISMAAIGTKLYVAGGALSVGIANSLYEWDQASNTWSSKANMPEGVYDGAAAVDGTDLYVIGGVGNDTPNATRRVQRWKQATDEWVDAFHLDTTMLGAFGGCIGGRLYRYGGLESFGDVPNPNLQELVVTR